MPHGSRHRKRLRHYEDELCVHELTFSCYRRLPLLTNDVWRTLLGEAVTRACERHRFRLVAFVWMPDHVHLLVVPTDAECSIARLLRAIKRPFSYRIRLLLEEADSPLLPRLTVRQRPGVTTFRFWQEGAGYDRNLHSEDAILSAVDYIHLNPVRRGLCDQAAEWRWSSARFYEMPDGKSDPALPRIDGLNRVAADIHRRR